MTVTLNRQIRRGWAKKLGVHRDALPGLVDAYREMEEGRQEFALSGDRAYAQVRKMRNGIWREVMVGKSLTEAIETVEPTMGAHGGGIYRNHLHLLMERGRHWTSLDVTLLADMPKPHPEIPGDGECYESAYRIAKHYGLRYAEGFIMHIVTPEGFDEPERVAVNHAFCVDPTTGRIVEFWPEPATEYVGIIFEDEQLDEAAEMGLGIIPFDHLRGYDLLRRGLLGRDYISKRD